MSGATEMQARYGACMAALVESLRGNDEAGFHAALDELLRLRESGLLDELRTVASNLQTALDRFRLDPRIVDLAEKEIPDARQRLKHVLTLTEEAANRTLDLVEQSCPPAERICKEAAALGESWATLACPQPIDAAETQARIGMFLQTAQADAEIVRRNLAEVLLAQGYQDLTGQIIRNVMALVTELETTLIELTRLADRHASDSRRAADNGKGGFGPVVPGVTDTAQVVNGQQDVDALLAGLGM